MGASRVLRRSEWEFWATEEYAEDGQSREWKGATQANGVPEPWGGSPRDVSGWETGSSHCALVPKRVARVDCPRRRSVGKPPHANNGDGDYVATRDQSVREKTGWPLTHPSLNLLQVPSAIASPRSHSESRTIA
jgi:hypothetical protein